MLAEKYGVSAAAITFARRGMPDGMTMDAFNSLVNILEANKAMAKLSTGKEDRTNMGERGNNNQGKRGGQNRVHWQDKKPKYDHVPNGKGKNGGS